MIGSKKFWKPIFIIIFIIFVLYITKILPLQIVLIKFARAHEYNLYYYNCVNYSKDLNMVLKDLGYNSTIVCGKDINDPSIGHCWVNVCLDYQSIDLYICFDVEPQSGLITDYTKRYRKIEDLNNYI